MEERTFGSCKHHTSMNRYATQLLQHVCLSTSTSGLTSVGPPGQMTMLQMKMWVERGRQGGRISNCCAPPTPKSPAERAARKARRARMPFSKGACSAACSSRYRALGLTSAGCFQAEQRSQGPPLQPAAPTAGAFRPQLRAPRGRANRVPALGGFVWQRCGHKRQHLI
jgi:hypothetical protein